MYEQNNKGTTTINTTQYKWITTNNLKYNNATANHYTISRAILPSNLYFVLPHFHSNKIVKVYLKINLIDLLSGKWELQIVENSCSLESYAIVTRINLITSIIESR